MAGEQLAEQEYEQATAEVCRQLKVLCRSKATRTVGIPPDHPSRWQPGTVRHPQTGELFDTASAWPFIADCLERAEMLDGSIPVEVKELRRPPGKRGYVLIVDGQQDDRIYIKLQFGHRGVIGRSFHISDKKGSKR